MGLIFPGWLITWFLAMINCTKKWRIWKAGCHSHKGKQHFLSVFSMIWPTDLVFDPTWPIFELDRDIVKMIILMMIGPKLWTLECSQGFSMIWPTDLVSDPTWPIFELDRDIVKMIILSIFDEDWTKTVASRVFTRFFLLSDLVFDPIWPIFELDRDSVKMIILMMIGPKLWALECSQGFFYDLTYWPSFWPDMIHIRTWQRYCQDDHSEQVWWRLDQNCGL